MCTPGVDLVTAEVFVRGSAESSFAWTATNMKWRSTIIRDRVRSMITKGAALAKVKAARLTADYDTRYGATTGAWTTDMFVEAVYRDLSGRK